MSFPLGDWQFWAVTASALGAAWMLVRPFLGSSAAAAAVPCQRCGTAARAACRSGGGQRLVALGKRSASERRPDRS